MWPEWSCLSRSTFARTAAMVAAVLMGSDPWVPLLLRSSRFWALALCLACFALAFCWSCSFFAFFFWERRLLARLSVAGSALFTSPSACSSLWISPEAIATRKRCVSCEFSRLGSFFQRPYFATLLRRDFLFFHSIQDPQ